MVLMCLIISAIFFPLLTIASSGTDAFQWSSTSMTPKIPGGDEIVPASDLRDPQRKIWIITTACLPWLTGTSVNPLLRAAHLAKDRPTGRITLMVPWLAMEDQDIAFPPGVRFANPDAQREYVKKWLIDDAQIPQGADKLNIMFYTARYHDDFHSIFPMGDISALIPDEDADVCVLEEPEHLNWYRAPFTEKAWIDKFKHVIGIIHTNYLIYTRGYTGGAYKEPMLYYVNQGMCRANCHKIIKLSGALQEFAAEKEEICNVHGVRGKYISIGDTVQAQGFKKGAYFVGKLAWAKGLDLLFQQMNFVQRRTGKSFHIDIYGQGPNTDAMKAYVEKNKLPVRNY
jgi:digalactosyldiacylglycerol synthase